MSNNLKFPQLVFIVEDNVMYAKTLQIFLKTRFPATETELFTEGETMLEKLYKKPDFIIMDYYLDSSRRDAANGLTMIGEIKARDPKAQIFILSSQQDINVALAVKEAGCLYLVKNSDTFTNLEELIVKTL